MPSPALFILFYFLALFKHICIFLNLETGSRYVSKPPGRAPTREPPASASQSGGMPGLCRRDARLSWPRCRVSSLSASRMPPRVPSPVQRTCRHTHTRAPARTHSPTGRSGLHSRSPTPAGGPQPRPAQTGPDKLHKDVQIVRAMSRAGPPEAEGQTGCALHSIEAITFNLFTFITRRAGTSVHRAHSELGLRQRRALGQTRPGPDTPVSGCWGTAGTVNHEKFPK